MIKASIVIPPGFEKQLENGVLKYGSMIVNDTVALNFQKIANDIGEFIAKAAGETEVMKSLRGQGGVDLPAHFGLSDGDANGLVDGMLNIIRGSVVVGFNTQHANGRGTIIIRAVESDFQKFLTLPGASYVSQPSDITIPIMEWMLLDPSIDIGAAAYQIVFQGDKNFHSTNSRSGRAIMVSLTSLGGGGGYVLPGIISGTGGGNFLEFAISQPGIAEKCAQIVIDRIK